MGRGSTRISTRAYGAYFQRKGIGSKLLKETIEEGKKRGLKWLHVDFEPDLIKFYRNSGFKHTEAGLINLYEEF